MTPEPGPSGIVDLKIPVTWLLSATVAMGVFMVSVGWNASQQSNKLDQLITANAKLEKRLDDRDLRIDGVRETIFAMQRVNDALALRVTALENTKGVDKGDSNSDRIGELERRRK